MALGSRLELLLVKEVRNLLHQTEISVYFDQIFSLKSIVWLHLTLPWLFRVVSVAKLPPIIHA